jgi:hypothetical protein
MYRSFMSHHSLFIPPRAPNRAWKAAPNTDAPSGMRKTGASARALGRSQATSIVILALTLSVAACDEPSTVPSASPSTIERVPASPSVFVTDATPRTHMTIEAILAALKDPKQTQGTLIVGVKEAGAIRGVSSRGMAAPVTSRRAAESAIRHAIPTLPILTGVSRVVRNHGGGENVVTDTVNVTFLTVRPPQNAAFLEALRRHPNVDYIEPNYTNGVVASMTGLREALSAITRAATPSGSLMFLESRPWGMDTVRATSVWPSYDGSGVNLSIIDTGLDMYGTQSHPDIQSYVKLVNYIEGNPYLDNACSDTQGTSPCFYEAPYHGTGVFGAARAAQNGVGSVGAAPSSAGRVTVGKVTYLNGVGALVVAADAYATAVRQLSDTLVARGWSTTKYTSKVGVTSTGFQEGASNAIEDAFNFAYYERDVLWFAFSGNQPQFYPELPIPARYASVVAVGAIARDLVPSVLTQGGPKVEFAAPGENLHVSWNRQADDGGAFEYTALQSGTSFAAPIAAGVALLARQKFPAWTAADTRREMQEHARDIHIAGRDVVTGYGLPDAVCLLDQIVACTRFSVSISGPGNVVLPSSTNTWTASIGNGPGGTYTYRWERSSDNGATWGTVGFNSPSLTQTVYGQVNYSFLLRVHVTAAGGNREVSPDFVVYARKDFP